MKNINRRDFLALAAAVSASLVLPVPATASDSLAEVTTKEAVAVLTPLTDWTHGNGLWLPSETQRCECGKHGLVLQTAAAERDADKSLLSYAPHSVARSLSDVPFECSKVDELLQWAANFNEKAVGFYIPARTVRFRID